MSWFFDNLQMVLAVGGALAYWLHQRKQAAEGGPEDSRNPAPATRPDADAMEMEERTRRIQEEIRRKILERTGELEPPPMEPELVEPPPLARWIQDRAEETVPEFREEQPQTERELIARQQAMEEQMDALAAQRAATRAKARAVHFPGGAAARAAALAMTAERSLVAELRDPRSLRRAVVLREILGPPVALR